MLYFNNAKLAHNVRAAWRSGGFTNVYTGYKRSISHYIFRGVNAAVAPNRQL